MGNVDPNSSAALSAYGSAIAAGAALIALFFTGMAAFAAHKQTKLQKQIATDAAQPYVWADMRPDTQQGGLLTLVVGNSGPTVATNVRVSFDPLLQMPFQDGSGHALEVLTRGIPSLPPGRTFIWNLGGAWQIVAADNPKRYALTIEADGPFGTLTPLTYTVDIDDIKQTRAMPDGSLHLVTEAVTKTNKTLESIANVFSDMERSRNTQQAPDRGRGWKGRS